MYLSIVNRREMVKSIPIGAEIDAEPMKLRLTHPSSGSTSMISSAASVVTHSSNNDDGTTLKLCENSVWA